MAPSGLTVNLSHGYLAREPFKILELAMPAIVLTAHDGSEYATAGATGNNLART